MKTILLISPYWKEPHRWMVSSVKLAELWQRMGYRVIAVCMGEKTGTEEVSHTLTVHRVKDFFFPDPFNYGIAPTFLFHVLKFLRREKPDIIVCNKVLFWTSLVVPVLKVLGKKVIVTTDTLVGITWWPRGHSPKILMAIGAWTAGWLTLLCAHRVAFFHPQPAHVLQRLGITKKSLVIPTGLDTNGFRPYPAMRRGEEISITYVGRLESVKGVDDFLAAAVPLTQDFPHIKVQVVGWYKESHPLVKQYGDQVIFTGLRHDIPEILCETDIFVLPSYSEGLSNSLQEAMASSCACVVTGVGGNTFLIEDGISGLLFQPGDIQKLREHLRVLIHDRGLRERLGQEARKRMQEVFDWSVIEGKYARLFADVYGK